MEVEALLGMVEVLSRSPNAVIMLEWQLSVNPRRNDDKAMRLIRQLRNMKL